MMRRCAPPDRARRFACAIRGTNCIASPVSAAIFTTFIQDIGLSKLEYFNLSANAISNIGQYAFEGLSALTVLDLSQNHLHYLLAETFALAKSLRILQLSRNNFNSHVPKLQCLSLTNLALDSCQISHIPADTFIGLPHLRILDLSNNLMIQLDSAVLRPLKLKQLFIEGNQWSCNKLMHDLELYLINNNIIHRAVCDKIPGPKKFEKMIVYDPQMKYEKHRPSIANVNIKKNTQIPRKNFTSVPTIKNITVCVNETESNLKKMLNTISPYWFFMIGFLLGSACGTFACYIWLTKRITCCRRYRERQSNDIQRVSLLQNLWQFDDPAFNDGEHGTISCPGTPPPPYRDVMLRPGLYRSPSIITNANNNSATNSTGRT
ncbi:leucine-rich repeat-containing protein 15-like isoform X2 [Odontomachus brunneus]|uniref:leucine-rich repeat-containing protein 15-like isoform X2 n=1 Tax=Odontomachus brunneus TaxID=486640 RepID=UPI0013F28970|nr:leucine-rich repeat-containing protein 15-like isoform X2 [Odontomachus brunneus]